MAAITIGNIMIVESVIALVFLIYTLINLESLHISRTHQGC